MYAVTSLPLDSRTLATFRNAELGFLGVTVLTLEAHPPLLRTGVEVLDFTLGFGRPARVTNQLIYRGHVYPLKALAAKRSL